MAISYVGQATGINSATLPTHQAGDLILAFAYRDGSTSAPTIPGTWTTIASGTGGGGSSNSSAFAYFIATGSGTSSGTWTNATGVVFQVYRGVTLIGANATSTGSTNTVTYPALTGITPQSWVVGFAGHRSINTTLETAPSGMTNRSNRVDTVCEVAGHDTDSNVSTWSSRTVTLTGTASNWITRVIEIEAIETFSLTETYSGSGTITGTLSPVIVADTSLTGNGTINGDLTLLTLLNASLTSASTVTANLTIPEIFSSLTGAGTTNFIPSIIYNNGIRFTEDGNRRVTESGVDERVLQGYTATNVLRDAAAGLVGAGTFNALASIVSNTQASILGTLTQNSSASLTAKGLSSFVGTGSLSVSGDITRYALSSLSGSGVFSTVASLTLDSQASLLGSLSNLSASTFTVGAVSPLEGTGTISATPTLSKNFITSLTGAGNVQALLGYQLDVTLSLPSTGQVTAFPSLTSAGSSSLSGVGSFDSVANRIVSTSLSLNSTGSITSSALFSANAQFEGQGTGTLGLSPTASKEIFVSLQGTGTFTIYPILINAASSLVGGTGIIEVYGESRKIVNATLTSTGTFNGTETMIYNAIVARDTINRVTENSDQRITSTGDFRVISGEANLGNSFMVATATVTSFTRGVYGKIGTQWGAVTARVKRNGSWVIPKMYVKQNDTWKRVY